MASAEVLSDERQRFLHVAEFVCNIMPEVFSTTFRELWNRRMADPASYPEEVLQSGMSPLSRAL